VLTRCSEFLKQFWELTSGGVQKLSRSEDLSQRMISSQARNDVASGHTSREKYGEI
jgi:hypothetical protein